MNRVKAKLTGKKKNKSSSDGRANSESDDDLVESSPVKKEPQMDASEIKAKNITSSAGTHRLNRILQKSNADDEDGYGGEDNRGAKAFAAIDPRNAQEVAHLLSTVVLPPLKVDPRSIGGSSLKDSKNAFPETMKQESLLCFRSKAFEATNSSGRIASESISVSALQDPTGYAKHKRSLGLFTKGSKGRFKLHYIALARSTNKPLPVRKSGNKSFSNSEKDANKESDGGYDNMFSDENEILDPSATNHESERPSEGGDDDISLDVEVLNKETEKEAAKDGKDNGEPEVSSFPALVCMYINQDGTNPDIRMLIELDQLTAVQDVSGSIIQLAFAKGETVRIDFNSDEEDVMVVGDEKAPLHGPTMVKERFIWSLLQIHAMLCVSVVERSSVIGSMLPPLNIRNLDRSELQYISTMQNFLGTSPTLRALLNRHIRAASRDDGGDEEEKHDLDGTAYDLMMGNFATRVAIYHSVDERAEAEEVLNSTKWSITPADDELEEEAVVTDTQRLSTMLNKHMHDLEGETCRRLIAWEDEKHYSVTGRKSLYGNAERDTVDALSLASLFDTFDKLDKELAEMLDWLEERSLAIKPLTDDCRDIDEENRQLEQKWRSYDMLGSELSSLLDGLFLDKQTQEILDNPASTLVYDNDGSVDVNASEGAVSAIYNAGKTLQEALDQAKKRGGIHLTAVSEQVEKLQRTSDIYCTSLAQIIVTLMEQFKQETVAGSDYGKVSKQDTHTAIAKKVRDTQRKFQGALLGYVNLIEVLAMSDQRLIPAIRDAYSEMVSEGILMKKRMKGYFQALPGKNTAYLVQSSKNFADYSFDEKVEDTCKTCNADDIRNTLSEMLPVVAREAYFTAALFGASSKAQDGREKKRNFENAKKSVDHSSQYFRYYAQRTCGIIEDSPGESTSRLPPPDPMLSLIASIHLNEAMEHYIDRDRKGGDHSLSLAYVRATILDLRKKVDKQWVTWVESQIEWIRTNDGVPANGKSAGIFPSFASFPIYLDHIMFCCREGRRESYTPDISGIKVISYYLQKIATALLESLRVCAERETTDQQYASSVMQMENTYYFAQCLKLRGPEMSALFQKQIAKANAVCKASTDQYLGWMIKKEFKALHALFSNISKIRREVGDRDVPTHISKSTFVKTLSKESNREVMKEKIETMFSRMSRHLSPEGNLLPVAWKALVKVLYEWFGRWERLSKSLYKHSLDPSAADVVRLAKAAGSKSEKASETSSKPSEEDERRQAI